MTKTKTTKRALLASAFSLLLCVSMLVGSTFAWFTDSATTGVNMIQSGTIDIRLVDSMTGEDMEGKTLQWVAADGNTDILWEPGATYYTQPVRVMNYSNLSFYMDVIVSGFSGDMELLDVIDFKIVHAYACLPASQGGLGLSFDECNGRSYVYAGTGTIFTGEGKNGDNIMADSMGIQADWTNQMNDYDNDGDMEAGPGVGEPKPLYDLCIIAKMREEAGNKYQNLKLTGAALTLRATQAPHEYDSFDNMYDKDAEFPEGAVVSSEEDFAEALAIGGPIVLEKDIVVDGDCLEVSTGMTTTIDLNGKTIKVDGTGSAATDRLFYTQPGSNLVITGNGTIDFGDSISSLAVGGYGNITIENGTFIRNHYENADEFYPLIENTKNASAGTKLVINGGYFDSGYYAVKADGTPDCFNNCRQLINSTWSNCDIVVYGGTFVGANPAWGDEGMAALCTVCGGGTYCQQVFLDGQNRTDTELPAGYTITENTLEDGRPVFTVSYSK